MNHGAAYDYNGWRVTFNPFLPVTGRWRAERYGVGMCNNSKISIRRMIDAKNMQSVVVNDDLTFKFNRRTT